MALVEEGQVFLHLRPGPALGYILVFLELKSVNPLNLSRPNFKTETAEKSQQWRIFPQKAFLYEYILLGTQPEPGDRCREMRSLGPLFPSMTEGQARRD